MGKDIEIIKQVYAGLNSADVESIIKLLDTNIVRNEPEEFPAAGTYRGHAQMREHIDINTKNWAEGACEPVEFFTQGNKTVVDVHIKVRLKTNTFWFDTHVFDGFTIKDGLITEFHTFGSKEKAFTWAGYNLKKIIFACVHNAGRSQMAAAFFNKFADPTKAVAISAGTEPATKVHPEVLDVMKEVGIDLSKAQPTRLTQELANNANILVTMGCGEKCPYVPGLKIEDWKLDDPKGQSTDQVRFTRDKIKNLVQELIKNL